MAERDEAVSRETVALEVLGTKASELEAAEAHVESLRAALEAAQEAHRAAVKAQHEALRERDLARAALRVDPEARGDQ